MGLVNIQQKKYEYKTKNVLVGMKRGKGEGDECSLRLRLRLRLIREGRKESKGSDIRTRKTVFQMMVLKEVFRITQYNKLPFKAIQIRFQNERSKKGNGMMDRNGSGVKSEHIDPVRLLKVILRVIDRSKEGPNI